VLHAAHERGGDHVNRRVPQREQCDIANDQTSDRLPNSSSGASQHPLGNVECDHARSRRVVGEVLACSGPELEREPVACFTDQPPPTRVHRLEQRIEQVVQGRHAVIAASHPIALARLRNRRYRHTCPKCGTLGYVAESSNQPVGSGDRLTAVKRDADYIFYELTRSICPECRRPIDAQIVLRDGKVFMRKRCPLHGQFEALIYADAQAYTSQARFNKPGTIPLGYSSPIERGCPHDCGLCPDHQQHACLGIIEVNSACNMQCPLCFANAGAGFSLTLAEVEEILDDFVRTEGYAEVVQFSGGEPTIHPEIVPMLRAAKQRNVRHVMINTNGKRIATDDAFLQQLADIQPAIYFQFDGFLSDTYRVIRGEPDILPEKLRALDRLAEIGCKVVLVSAIERGVNECEVGDIVRFGMRHPAVFGVNFQPAFHAGRYMTHDPLQRITIPDVLRLIEQQTDGVFVTSDFVPVPCCFPTCNSVTYAYVDGDTVLPITRLMDVEDYLDYISNRILPGLGDDVLRALEGLWSSSAVPGSDKATSDLLTSCAACQLPEGLDIRGIANRMFMVMLQDFMDPWTFNQKNVMKCCKEFLLPGGKQIPFCAYNSVGYREQARIQLAARQRLRVDARRRGQESALPPVTFDFPSGGDNRVQ
jgi:tetraether lipid synthase